MVDSDVECYEELDGISPPPSSANGGHFIFNKTRSMTHTGLPTTDARKSLNSSHFPPDIDNRPPYPIPKGASKHHHGNGGPGSSPGHLNYNQIIVSPVAPDYELSSVSPPFSNNSYGMPICGQQLHKQQSPVDNRPPLPPINPHRKPPTRSHSESSDSAATLSKTPPRSMTMGPNTRQMSSNTITNGGTTNPSSTARFNGSSKHHRSNSDGDAITGGSHEVKPSTSESSLGSGKYYKSSSEMPLRVFSEHHKQDLPLQVVVTKGYYGPDERTSISDGDMFNVHFFKQTKIVKIQDANSYEYTVPLNSSLEFGLVYQLPSGFKQIDLKYHFKTVADIVQLKTLPKVLRATQSHRGSGPESSVEKNDLLLVQEVKTKKRSIKSSKVLKCTVAGTGMKKTLNEDCAGYFSVKPMDTRLFLPEIVEHITLPERAFIYSSTNSRIDLPQHLLQTEIEVLRVEIEESIVATSIYESNREKKKPVNPYNGNTPLVDIPQDLDIEVAIIKLGDGETTQLYADTRSLCEKYNPSEAAYLNLPSSITASAQSTLFRTIRQDHNRQVGIEILRPSNAFKNPEGSVNRLSNGSDGSRKQLCTPSECANAEEVNSRLESLEMHAASIDDRLNKFELLIQTAGNKSSPDMKEQKQRMAQLQEEVKKTREETEQMQKIVSDLPDQIAKLNSTVDTLQRTVDLLQSEVKKIPKDQLRQASSMYVKMRPADSNGMHVYDHTVTTPPKANGLLPSVGQSKADFEAQNKEILQRLNHAQVTKLLSSMNMSQYEEAFTKEQISGEILLELNDHVLEKELGITSRIHRIKLMKVIDGRHSALSILNGDDPYYVHLSQS